MALTQAASCNRITLPLYTIIYPDAIASLEATVSSSTKWDNNGDHTALADLRHDAGLRRAYGQRWGPSLFTRRETEALIAELAAQTDRAKRGSQATSCALEVPTATVYSVSATGGGQTGGGACGEHLPPLGRLPWDLVIYILLLAFAREQEAGPRLASTLLSQAKALSHSRDVQPAWHWVQPGRAVGTLALSHASCVTTATSLTLSGLQFPTL